MQNLRVAQTSGRRSADRDRAAVSREGKSSKEEMEFFGIEVKPGKAVTYEIESGKTLRITQVT